MEHRVRVSGRHSLDLVWLFVLGALWGSSYLFIKVAVSEVPPLTLVAARLVLGAALLWGLLLASGQRMPRSRSMWGTYTIMGFLNGMLPYSLVVWGEQHIPSGLAALLQATMPIFTVILAHLLTDDERLTWLRALGIVIGFIGVGILMLSDLRQGLQANLWGQMAIVGSSASYASAAVFARSRLREQPALVSTTGQLTMGAVLTVPVSLWVDRPFDLSPSLPAVGSWLGLTILGTVIAYLIYYALIGRTGATFVSTVTYIIPVYGLLLGAWVLDEPLTAPILVSLALILLGVLLVRR
ncbi:MAG: DMT family transporter [Anaerolineae bacterium]